MALGFSEFDFDRQYRTELYFVAGPNVGTSSRSSTKRTFNQLALQSYDVFKDGVRHAVRTGLLAMAHSGCDVVLLAGVSTGIYSGPYKDRIRSEYASLVNDLLSERLLRAGHGGRPSCLGDCFRRVVWTQLE